MKQVLLCLMLIAACNAQVVFPSDPEVAGTPSTAEDIDKTLLDGLTVDLRRTGNVGSRCRTPTGESGVCTSFQSCPSYRQLLRSDRSASVVQFLRQRICSVANRRIFLCCPNTGGNPFGTGIRPGSANSPIIPPRNQCGTPSVNKVIAGETSQLGEWPWLAAIGQKEGPHFIATCGGTLITRKHVLTAAHCFDDPRFPNPPDVRLAEHNLESTSDGARPQDFKIAGRRSPGYNRRTHENDIEILILDREVIFNQLIKPACLPFNERNNEFPNSALTVVGWGRTSVVSSRTSSEPMQAIVPVVDKAFCSKAYERIESKPVVDHRHICAGDGVSDSCGGDSGGPLHHLSSDGKYVVVGIVSFAVDCARKDFPGVYTKVGSYMDWIVGTVEST